MRKYKYPVYGTQGGGIVRRVGDKFIFVKKPNCPGLDVGDDMPEEWDIIPANDLARQEEETYDPLLVQPFELADIAAVNERQPHS